MQWLCQSERCSRTGCHQAGFGVHSFQNYGTSGRIRFQQGENRTVYHQVRTVLHPLRGHCCPHSGSSAGQPFSGWIYRALTFLIISCPCALVISVPLSFFGGIGCASKNGVLVKGSNYLEALSHAQTVVMDKTGTLTEGKFHVTRQKAVEITPEEQLELAALAESASNHPIAQSLKEAYGKAIDTERVEDVQEIAGHGVSARVDGKQVLAGNAAYLEDAGLQPETPTEIGTAVHLAVNGVYAGYILIADTIKPDAAQAVQAFRQAGVSTVAMLTGDSERTAAAIAKQVGVDRFFAEVLPEDKANFVQQAKAEGHTVVMIGDGINDSPALSAADIGIAINSGAAIAREIADVTIKADSLEELVALKAIANSLQKRVHANYRFVLTFNSALIALGALGILQPASSAMLHNLSTIGISLKSMTNLLPENKAPQLKA